MSKNIDGIRVSVAFLCLKSGDKILLHKRQRLYMHRFYKLKINAISPNSKLNLDLK